MAHEDLKRQYEADAQWHLKPWELWEVIDCGIEATLYKPPVWHPDNAYRRKPDAPERNCAMCKFSTTNYYFSCCLDLSRDPFSLKSMTHPDWCPLAQKEEPYLLTAARDLLKWLEGFELMRGAEKVRALRKAVEEAEK